MKLLLQKKFNKPLPQKSETKIFDQKLIFKKVFQSQGE